MERTNLLSINLKAYQRAKKKTLAEFSEELGIAKSTIQSVMMDGNTTMDTLIRVANALQVSLDELVFGELPVKRMNDVQCFLKEINCFVELSPEKQKRFRYLLDELLKLCENDD